MRNKEYKHNSRTNRWEQNDKGRSVSEGGTSMLINSL